MAQEFIPIGSTKTIRRALARHMNHRFLHGPLARVSTKVLSHEALREMPELDHMHCLQIRSLHLDPDFLLMDGFIPYSMDIVSDGEIEELTRDL